MWSKKSLFYLLILTLFFTFNLISCGGGGGGDVVVVPQNLKLFVTSAKGTADLTSWDAYIASGSTATGLEAADAICQHLAGEAGLKGTYRAWLSDMNTDAYCHLHGLTGKKATGCDGTLPTPYGPWVRMDKFPFGERIDVIIDEGKIYAPVRFDEKETELADWDTYFTATDPTGELDVSGSNTTCSDWNDGTSDDEAVVGHPSMTNLFWTKTNVIIKCNDEQRLLCMQTGKGPALPSHKSSGKIVFVTSKGHNGNFGGDLTEADAFCQMRADAATLPGTYTAWLSNSTTDAIDRITEGARVRVDGVRIANSIADLTDNELFSSINVTEEGKYLGNAYVWTGTSADGAALANRCNDWTSNGNSVFGRVGRASAANRQWSDDYRNYSCSMSLNLYCFQD